MERLDDEAGRVWWEDCGKAEVTIFSPNGHLKRGSKWVKLYEVWINTQKVGEVEDDFWGALEVAQEALAGVVGEGDIRG